MAIVLGILFLIVSLALILGSLFKLFFVGTTSSSVKHVITVGTIGIIFFISSVLLISLSSDKGISKGSLGIIFFVLSFFLIGLGSWIAFFSPFHIPNNYQRGLSLIIIGFIIIVLTVIMITNSQHLPQVSNSVSSSTNIQANNRIQEFFNHRLMHLNDMKLGNLGLILLAVANLMVLRRPSFTIFLKANLVVVIFLIIIAIMDQYVVLAVNSIK